jgi:ABC-type sugar transport system permease subunit
MTNTQKTQLQTAALFLAPNLLGFFVFTFGPILISLAGSFSTWSLRPAVPLRFIGLRNYVELFADANFYFYLFNTIYMLLALPIGIAGSLGLAVLLSQKLDLQRSGPRAQARLALAALILSLVTAGLVACLGMKNLALILGSLGCVTSIGLYFGSVGYRTIYYLPTFTAGAGTILLWTQLFNPNFGLLNQVSSGMVNQHQVPARLYADAEEFQ